MSGEKKPKNGKNKNIVYIKSLIVLVSVCLVIAVAMAVINAVTAPRIEEANRRAEEEALRTVVDGASGFEKLEGSYPETVQGVYRETDGDRFAVTLQAKGYDSSKPIRLAVGIDGEGRIIRCHVISASGETAGIGSKVQEDFFLSPFVGQAQELEGVDAISGATISSRAFIDAVKDAFVAVDAAKEVGA